MKQVFSLFFFFFPIFFSMFFLTCASDIESAKNDKSSNSDEVEALKKALTNEKTLKTQAVNKLAEIIQRKDVSSNKGKSKANSNEVKKKEKENKKLNMELREVNVVSSFFFFLFIFPYHEISLGFIFWGFSNTGDQAGLKNSPFLLVKLVSPHR